MEQGPPSSRQQSDATDLGTAAATRKTSAARLRGLGPVERVKRERFSWMSRRVLIESRNDVYAKVFHDIVVDERPRWIAARKAAGAEQDFPGFVIDRTDVALGGIVLVGDPGEGDESQMAVAEAIASTAVGTAFMVIVSDVIYPSGDVNEYAEKFYRPFDNYPQTIYALPGNHDWYDGLDGFMFHFCGAEPLPRLSYRAGSYPQREYLARLVWRKASRPSRTELLGLREGRPPPQPGPYFVIETRYLDLVSIDTGIKGTVDHEQGQWLLDVSKRPKPKILLTGKPLVVDNEVHPCPIEWGAPLGKPDKPPPATVDEVVRDPEHKYVAAIGGDIHNYQRCSIPLADGRRMEYVVSGGGGAYMSETHTIGPAEELRDVRGDPVGITEDDTKLYPRRGHSLALYSQELFRRAPAMVGGAVLLMLAGIALGALLWTGDSWQLWRAGLFIAGIGAVQLLYGLASPRERLPRIASYGAGLAVLGGAVVLLSEWGADQIGATATTVLVAAAPLGVPLGVVAVRGWGARRHAALTALLLLMVLATHLLQRDTVQTAVHIATATVVGLTAIAGLAAPRLWRKIPRATAGLAPGVAGRARSKLVWVAIGLVAVALLGLEVALFEADFSKVAAVLIASYGVVPVVYLLAIGVFAVALRRGIRSKVHDVSIVDHAAKYAGERLGIVPVLPSAQELPQVDPKLRRLFNRVWPRGSWAVVSPLHVLLPEVFDRDVPPMAKNFVELEIAAEADGPVLYIRGYGVTGVTEGARTLEDELGPISLR